ncbi:MAG: hypothetical protein K9M80_01170 [Candidatus Marinimicrobia bacterium]|nr:hypothetical protein [Candidatus Neomarinimicrobiota bacterium]
MFNLSKSSFIILLICPLILFNCSKNQLKEPEYQILAKIGDKEITVNEFIKRAEYTIRPPYCKTNYGVSKNIILNSLIAEKLMALEVNPDSVIVKDSHLAKYVKGRKEQAMRRFHFYKHGTQKVKLDSNEIKEIYKLAGREYKIKYFNFPDKELANQFMEQLQQHGNSFQQVVNNLQVEREVKIPEMEVKFTTSQSDAIHSKLYSSGAQNLKSGDIIGPLETHAKNYVILQIDDIKSQAALSNEQIKTRHNDVREYLRKDKAKSRYAQYVHQLMAGKEMQFNKNTFKEVAKVFSEIYTISKKKKKESLNDALWGKNIEQLVADSLGNTLNNLNHQVLFTLDGNQWTVEDFREELLSHPLVFRKKGIHGLADFAKQFRLAIADLIRDHYITQDAYKTGYEETEYVQNYTNMWRDEILATYDKYRYLNNVGYEMNFRENYLQAINTHLNSYVDSLQNKYSQSIEINTETFDNIQLTNIDLFALESNAAYPIVVPNFPIITTDTKLEYGTIMKE